MIFHIKYSHFKYQVISFDLSNVPANFYGYINKILAKKLSIFIIVHLHRENICKIDLDNRLGVHPIHIDPLSNTLNLRSSAQYNSTSTYNFSKASS